MELEPRMKVLHGKHSATRALTDVELKVAARSMGAEKLSPSPLQGPKVNYWINTISRDHVQRGVAGGFTQAGHGKASGLKRLKAGDWVVFYSPKTSLEGGEPLQAFTAIGQVKDEELYQVEMFPGFVPWRRNLTFYPCREQAIKPLIGDLSFIEDKTHWGYKFRFGLFQIPEDDFLLLRSALLADVQ